MQIVFTGADIRSIREQMQAFLDELAAPTRAVTTATADTKAETKADTKAEETAPTDAGTAKNSTEFYNEIVGENGQDAPTAQDCVDATIMAKEAGVDAKKIKDLITSFGSEKVSGIAPEKRHAYLDGIDALITAALPF